MLELLRGILLCHGADVWRGIPLGNVTSQLFANIYLHELDWFMKQTLEVHWYIRYCDDFVIVSHDKTYLESLIEPIMVFKDNLQTRAPSPQSNNSFLGAGNRFSWLRTPTVLGYAAY